jgi:hypothetical protein
LFFGNLFVPNSDFYEIVNAWKLTSTVANVADLLLFISASTNRWFTDFYNFFFLLVFWECLWVHMFEMVFGVISGTGFWLSVVLNSLLNQVWIGWAFGW